MLKLEISKQAFTFRVVLVTRITHDDAGFAYRTPVYCVVNQKNDVYAVFWGHQGGELSALNYRDRLSPTMQPPALGGQVDNGIYFR